MQEARVQLPSLQSLYFHLFIFLKKKMKTNNTGQVAFLFKFDPCFIHFNSSPYIFGIYELFYFISDYFKRKPQPHYGVFIYAGSRAMYMLTCLGRGRCGQYAGQRGRCPPPIRISNSHHPLRRHRQSSGKFCSLPCKRPGFNSRRYKV